MPDAPFFLVPAADGNQVEGLAIQPLQAGAKLTVGRKTTCSLVIPEEHAYVSGEHCCVEVPEEGHEVRVHDLSANGTFLNGNRIGKGKSAVIAPNAEVSLAR